MKKCYLKNTYRNSLPLSPSILMFLAVYRTKGIPLVLLNVTVLLYVSWVLADFNALALTRARLDIVLNYGFV